MFSKFTRIVAIIATVLTLQSCSKSSDSSTTPAPVAAFTFTASGTVAPETVTFTNSSSNATSYSWSFGDGTTSTQASPSHVFTTSGSYTVTLTAINAGGSNQTSQTVNVGTAVAAPVASFTYSGANTFAPDNVSFTNTSTNATSYSWSWGDNTAASTTATASHVFTSAGVYTVTLTATNAGGSNSTSQTINVLPPPTKVQLDTIIVSTITTQPSYSNNTFTANINIDASDGTTILSYANGYTLGVIPTNTYTLTTSTKSFYTFSDLSNSSTGIYQVQLWQAASLTNFSGTKLGFVFFQPYQYMNGANAYPTSIPITRNGTNMTLLVKWLP